MVRPGVRRDIKVMEFLQVPALRSGQQPFDGVVAGPVASEIGIFAYPSFSLSNTVYRRFYAGQARL